MSCLRLRPIALAVLATLTLSACSTIQPQAFEASSVAEQIAADRVTAAQGVEPISGGLTLDEALARALKYNLDRRTRMMEEALAFQQLDVAHIDMLPKLLARAGFTERNNDKISQSRDAEDGSLSPSRFVSQEQAHTLSDLGVSWNLLDLGVGYYNSQQQADRVLIAAEKRRKAMHLLMQDVRTAYWRAASAQKLRDRVRETIAMGEDALADARQAEQDRIRNPIDTLRYQRQVLENLRLLEAIDQELSSAQVELAALINAPIGQVITIAEPTEMVVATHLLDLPVDRLEDVALSANPDLREHHYSARIARQEARKTLVKLFPSVTFNYSVNYDTDRYLVNNRWNEVGVQLSFNLFNLFTGPMQMRLAEAGVELADHRRVASQMAVLAQVHLARLQFANTLQQLDRADAIWQTDQRLAEHVLRREQVQAQSKLDRVSSDTAAILSLLRRYQALAQANAAEARLRATLGVEPQIGSVGELSLSDLVRDIGRTPRLEAAAPPAEPAAKAAPEPSVEPFVAEPAAQPVAEPAVAPAAETATAPVVEPAAQPVAEPAVAPAAETATAPVVAPAAQPATEPAAVPVAESVAAPAAETAAESATEPAAESAVRELLSE